jgi:peptide/nickel transport system permease protein
MTSPLPAPGAPLPHYVSPMPFDARSIEAMTAGQSRLHLASQWRLMWWKFKRHRLALCSGIFLAAFYFSILISEFLAPYDLHARNIDNIHAPPQAIHLFHDGKFIGPFVYGRDRTECIARLRRALGEMVVGGIETTIPLFQELIKQPDILDGEYNIHWLEHYLARRSAGGAT